MSCKHFNSGTCTQRPREAEVKVFTRGEVKEKRMKWNERCPFAPTRGTLEPVVVSREAATSGALFDSGVVHLLRNSGLAFEHCLEFVPVGTARRA